MRIVTIIIIGLPQRYSLYDDHVRDLVNSGIFPFNEECGQLL